MVLLAAMRSARRHDETAARSPRLLQQRQRLGIQQPAVLVDHQPFADAIEQLHAQLPLQIRQRRADRRLRQRQHHRGLSGRTAFQHFGEDFQLTQRDMHSRPGSEKGFCQRTAK